MIVLAASLGSASPMVQTPAKIFFSHAFPPGPTDHARLHFKKVKGHCKMLMMESVTLVFNSNDPLVYKIPARANLLERSARQNPHDEVVPNIPSHKKRKRQNAQAIRHRPPANVLGVLMHFTMLQWFNSFKMSLRYPQQPVRCTCELLHI